MPTLASAIRPYGMATAPDNTSVQPTKQVTPDMIAAQAQAQRPRGFFGALSDAFTGPNAGRNWQIVGAALRQLNTGGNDLDSLLQRLDQERAQQMQQAWQQTLQQHQTQEWQQADQQQKDEANLAASAPESVRPLATAFPHDYATARIRQELTPQMHLLTPDEVRAAGFQAGTVVQQNPQTGEYNVQQGPYHAPASIIVGNSASDDLINYTADTIAATGAPPQGLANRNPIVIQRAYQLLADRARGGDQSAAPANVATSRATYRANASSLSQLTTQRTAILRAENAARRNIQLAQQTLAGLERTDSHLANTWLQRGAALGNAPQLAASKVALERALDEYSRVIAGAYGAGGTPVTQMQNAREMLSTAHTPAEARAVFNIILSEMNNVRSSFDDQERELRSTMTGQPTAPAPAATPQADAPAPTQRLRYNPQTRQLEPVQ